MLRHPATVELTSQRQREINQLLPKWNAEPNSGESLLYFVIVHLLPSPKKPREIVSCYVTRDKVEEAELTLNSILRPQHSRSDYESHMRGIVPAPSKLQYFYCHISSET